MQDDVGFAVVMEPSCLAELRKLVDRAQGGMPSVLPMIQTILETKPEVWDSALHLINLVEEGWRQLGVGDESSKLPPDSGEKSSQGLTASSGHAADRLIQILTDMVAALTVATRVTVKWPQTEHRRLTTLRAIQGIHRRTVNYLKTVESKVLAPSALSTIARRQSNELKPTMA